MRRWLTFSLALLAIVVAMGFGRPTAASPAAPAQMPRLVVFEFFSKHL